MRRSIQPMTVAAAWVLGLASNAVADPAAGIAALRNGAPALIRVNADIGSLQRGGDYIVKIDKAAGRVAVSAARGGKLAAYPFDGAMLDQGLHIWGARFRWGSREGCLLQAASKEVGCAAQVLGPLVPDAIGGGRDVVAFGVWRLNTHLTQLVANPEAVIARAAACPSRPGLRQTHAGSRVLAESLRVNGAILPFITDEKSRGEAEALVDRAITQLMASTPPTSRTTYTQCYGGIDLITPFLVVRALDLHQRFKPRADVKAYLERLWPQLAAEGAIEANGARNVRDVMGMANGYAAYLHIATVMERNGIPAFQDYTWRGLDLLLDNQTDRPGRTCRDAKGNHAQARGGWPHGTIECSQNLGYHDFITAALIAVHERLAETGQCNAAMAGRCRRIEASLDAALVWIGALAADGARGPLLDRARGTSPSAERPGAGDVAGAQAGFRILAHRRSDPHGVRRTLVDALERAILARPSLVPVAAYLLANSRMLHK